MSKEWLDTVCSNTALLDKYNTTAAAVRENQARLASINAAARASPRKSNMTRDELDARDQKLRAETCKAKLTAGYSAERAAEKATTFKSTQRFYSQCVDLIVTFGQKTEGCMSGLRFGVWGEWALASGASKFFAFMKVLRIVANSMVIIIVNEHNTRSDLG